MNSTNKNTHHVSMEGKPLSRKQLSASRDNSSPRDTEAQDDFDKDAMEGWQKASAGMELMKKLDRRFLRKQFLIWVPVCLTLLIIPLYYILSGPDQQTARVSAQTPAKRIEKIDHIISPEILVMQELPKELQIQPKNIIAAYEAKSVESKIQERETYDEAPVSLPLKKPDIPEVKSVSGISKKAAHEIYLSGFKLVDYRAYRTRPSMPSQELSLSGTPADQEKNGIPAENNSAWKPIDVPYHDYIEQTMEQFNHRNYKQALNRTKSILSFYPDDVNALFYGGLCYYNLNEMDLAINAFQRVLTNPFNNFDEEATWYLANAFDLNKNKAKARETYQLIVNQKGYYAKQAAKMLKKESLNE